MERCRYRAYVLNKDNGIDLAIDLYCSDDCAARERPQQLVEGRDIELWQDARKITRLLSEEPATQDLKAKREKLPTEAAECEIIASLAS
jgi:hypothetical protein